MNKKPQEKYFSLGLSYMDILDLSKENLEDFMNHCSREELIDWLRWNDPNGVYEDNQSMLEFGNVVNKTEAMEIIINQVIQ